MDGKDKETAFQTIENFVISLSEIYKDDKPLHVFNQLIKKIKNKEFKGDENEVYHELILKAFNEFYSNHKQKISIGTIGELPRDACVTVTKGMKLNIPKYYTDADNDDRSNIAKTLLTIGCLLNPEDNEAFKLLEDFENKFRKLNVDNDTKEGAFVNSVVNMALGSMQSNSSDPFSNLANIGSALPKMISELQTGMEKGELDPQKMVSGFQNMIGSFGALIPQNATDAAEFIQNKNSSSDVSQKSEKPEDEDEFVVPVVEPRPKTVGEDGNFNMAGMMQMATGMMKNMAQQPTSASGESGNSISEVESAAVNSAFVTNMAKTVADTVSSAMDSVNDE